MKNRVVIIVESGVLDTVACDDPDTQVLVYDADKLIDPCPDLEDFLDAKFPADLGREAVQKALAQVRRMAKEVLDAYKQIRPHEPSE